MRTNNLHVPFSKLDKGLTSYLDALPNELQKNIVITSSVNGSHAKNSRHFDGRAVDIRIKDKDNPLADPLFNYLGSDQTRREKNIVVLDPRHGTAPHIHFELWNRSENRLDYFYGDSGVQDDHNHGNEVLEFQPTLRQWKINEALIADYNRLKQNLQVYKDKRKPKTTN